MLGSVHPVAALTALVTLLGISGSFLLAAPSPNSSEPNQAHLVAVAKRESLGRDRTLPSLSSQADFPTLNSEQLDRQLQRYLRYYAEFGAPDILIIGSSRAFQGVDPIALERTLADRGYPGLKIYNFGINGATAQVEDWLIRQLLRPEQLPRLIIWADNSRAFNEGRVDQTFENIQASAGQKLLAAGHYPPLPQVSPLAFGKFCLDMLPKTVAIDQVVQVGPIDPDGFMYPQPRPLLCQTALKTASRNLSQLGFGSGVSSASQTVSLGLSPVEMLGFRVVTQKFDPKTYFQAYPWVPSEYDADYLRFNLDGKQATALRSLVSFVRSRNIALAIVSLPLTPTHLNGLRGEYEQQFRAYMQQQAQAQGFAFYDLTTQKALAQNEFFEDPSHINRYGAEAVAIELGRTLAMPGEATPSVQSAVSQ